MLTRNWFRLGWQFGLTSCLMVIASNILVKKDAFAQLVPDNTLGGEGSLVNPIDALNDRINGGAMRGSNLFHSFLEFNVGESRGVYFANPAGIANILSRVTGGNPSNILGRLGVLGQANLFLLNPHGILFGPNASLDIKGSFVAATADGIQLGEKGFFSATEPHKSNLLSVSPGTLFFNQAATHSGSIINRGNLAVGKNLTLSANNLDLQGQLYAGENLTLKALDTVRIRDSVASPFIAAARGNLLVQGNQTVDIFALNHPESGLFSGGNLVLRSANTVGGDAHYWSLGNFRIETLDSNLGGLYSPYDPVIYALGDVSFGSYRGGSLHILAAGKVEISGDVTISGLDGSFGLVREVPLSDGTTISINGKTQLTLDIRAGVRPEVIGSASSVQGFGLFSNGFFPIPPDQILAQVISPVVTSADINIGGSVVVGPIMPGKTGKIFLSNQYHPNLALSGEITINSLGFTLNISDGGGAVTIDSRGGITLGGTINVSTTPLLGFLPDAGNVTLLAQNNINLPANSSIITSSSAANGGNITLKAGGNIFLEGAKITTQSFVVGEAGNVTLTAKNIFLNGGMITTSVPEGAVGNGGDIQITTDLLSLQNALISAEIAGTGNAGNIIVQNADSIFLDNSTITTQVLGTAKPNPNRPSIPSNITLNANSLTLTNNSRITASTQGGIDAGNITFNGDNLTLNGDSTLEAFTRNSSKAGNITVNASQSVTLGTNSQLTVETSGAGKAGDIDITTDTLTIGQDARLSANTTATGQGGSIDINANQINLSGRLGIFAETQSTAPAGNLTIQSNNTPNLNILFTDNGFISARTSASGQGGSIDINAPQTLDIRGQGSITVETSGSGNAGNINLSSQNLTLADGVNISASTTAEGNAGNINLNGNQITLQQANINAFTNGGGNAGSILISHQGNNADTVSLTNSTISTEIRENGQADTSSNIDIKTDNLTLNNATITASTAGTGDAGTISVENADNVTLNNSTISTAVTQTGIGQGGNIDLQMRSLSLTNTSDISAETAGIGDAGTISVRDANSVSLDDSSISTAVTQTGIGKGGDIDLQTRSLSLTNDSEISAETAGIGDAGTISVQNADNVTLDNSNISTAVTETGIGQGGDIDLQTRSLSLTNDSEISAETAGTGDAGTISVQNADNVTLNNSTISTAVTQTGIGQGGDIDLQTRSLTLNNAQINARSQGTGNAGNINLQASGAFQATNSDITTSAERASGGAIAITAQTMRLQGDSDISTNVASGAGGGGNITLTADSILAFDDSDILAFARDGQGGNITVNTPIFFGEGFSSSPPNTNPDNLDDNGRVDINASGALAGIIILPDLTFIRNSLTELPENILDTDNLIANSCVAPNRKQVGTFIITGSGGLPIRPGDASVSPYPTGDVRSVPNEESSRSWQMGDPIVEPQGVYRLGNGQLVLSRQCQ